MAITRASTDFEGNQANNGSGGASLSGDGNLVAFSSNATNLRVPSGVVGVVVKNAVTGEFVLASSTTDGRSLSGNSFAPSLAADGSAVAFATDGSEIVDQPSNLQIAVKNLSNGDISVVTAAANGTQGNDDSGANPSISGDGRLVGFSSLATNLVGGDTNATIDIFVKNVATGAITRASTAANGTQGNGASNVPSLAGNGGSVAFQSDATNLVAGDTNGTTDIFVKTLATGAIVRASTAANGTQANGASFSPSVSRDGNLVAFESTASNLVAGDTNGRSDVFVKNLTSGAITRVSTGTDGTEGNAESGNARISADGTKVTFTSRAGNLVPGDSNIVSDVFVKDLTTGTLTRVSVNASGTQGNAASSFGALSSDGSRIAFQSNATNLVPGDTNNAGDVFVADTVCYASGTRIRTITGEVAVEALRVGDFVVTGSGTARPIRWIGHRTLDLRHDPQPGLVMPVRIAAHAFGPGQPARDLTVSPAHALCVAVDGAEVLIPAMRLVNGTTLTRVAVESVTYWHIELHSHDILLAEGLPAESYLDCGNRSFFANAPVTELRAVPDVRPDGPLPFCRPFHEDGPVVEAVRARLEARARASGWQLDAAPALDLHLVADGRVIPAALDGLTARFDLPAPARDVRLVSGSSVPAEVIRGSADDRRLGVMIRSLVLDDGATGARSVALDDPRLSSGFHALERDGAGLSWRWTDGAAVLPAALWAGCRGALRLEVALGGTPLPRWVAPAPDAEAKGGLRHSA
ncbi:Hint domain-containing protein [Methylobacterium sp. J-078]|uniref:Hint domain-containing protein n=1 Tax=Methylobacterium sp. J-078 TaxID=2836657 RepID=UPI001FB8D8F9|nr:Hint domain-containing protein [Methylobacterium sp. J-078]MCJ2046949.1 Hint domain-containing protein [Methylobacterium sp. J-078]